MLKLIDTVLILSEYRILTKIGQSLIEIRDSGAVCRVYVNNINTHTHTHING